MRRALLIAVALVLVVPASAYAATLALPRAQRAALAEAQSRAAEETNGRSVSVGSCVRRHARTVVCNVGFSYTEEFDRRSNVDCESRDEICSQDPERRWAAQERNCTAKVTVRYVSPRRRSVTAVLSGQRCRPFFENEDQGGDVDPGDGRDDAADDDSPGGGPNTGNRGSDPGDDDPDDDQSGDGSGPPLP